MKRENEFAKLHKLVKCFKEGDESAFKEIYEAFYQKIYFTCIQYTKNEQDSLDLLQDTFLTVYKNIDKLENIEAFTSWTIKISVNKCNDFLKKNKEIFYGLANEDNENEAFEFVDDNIRLRPEEVLLDEELKIELLKIMDLLPDIQRNAVMLYYFNGMTVAEIAEVELCSEGAIKSRLRLAREGLKKRINEYEKKGVKLRCSFAGLIYFLFFTKFQDHSDIILKSGKIFENILRSVNEANGTKGANISQSNQSSRQNLQKNFNQFVIRNAKALTIGAIVSAGIIAGIIYYSFNKENTKIPEGNIKISEEMTKVESKEVVAIKVENTSAVSEESTSIASTDVPTETSTEVQSTAPTEAPTVAPTEAPTVVPTEAPTEAPTVAPTKKMYTYDELYKLVSDYVAYKSPECYISGVDDRGDCYMFHLDGPKPSSGVKVYLGILVDKKTAAAMQEATGRKIDLFNYK